MCLRGGGAAYTACPSISLSNNTNTGAMLRCHIYDNQSIIHLLGLPLPCVDPTAMLPAHIWLHGAPLSPGWDLPLVMGHLGGQMKLRLDECFVYYGYGALWRHWQLHIDSLLSRRPTSAVALFPLFRAQRTNGELWILVGFSVTYFKQNLYLKGLIKMSCELNIFSNCSITSSITHTFTYCSPKSARIKCTHQYQYTIWF